MRHLSTYFAVVALAPAVLGAQGTADLVLTNGRIYTVDNARPEASALAVRGARVLFVGSDREAKALAGPSTQVIDLHGATVVPGIIDAHAHLLGLGNMLQRVNLAGSTSYDEVIARVKAWAKDGRADCKASNGGAIWRLRRQRDEPHRPRHPPGHAR